MESSGFFMLNKMSSVDDCIQVYTIDLKKECLMKEGYIAGVRGRNRGERFYPGRGKGSRQRGTKTFRRGGAIDMVINEFVQVFELYEQETIEEMKGSKENEDN